MSKPDAEVTPPLHCEDCGKEYIEDGQEHCTYCGGAMTEEFDEHYPHDEID